MLRRDAGALLAAAFGGDSAEETVRTRVDALLAEAEVRNPPAPLDLLGSLRGVVSIDAVPMASAGRLVPLPDGDYIVQVREGDLSGRQRFSVAHEICHTFFDEARRKARTHDDRVTGAFNLRQSEEFLCDLGAARMLLHPCWLRELAGSYPPTLDRLFEIASTIEASAEATARQIVTLGIWRCSFVIWEPGFTKEERKRLERASPPGLGPAAAPPTPKLRAARVYAAGGMPFFPLRKSVDSRSSIAAALAEDRRTRGVERFDLGTQRLVVDCESQYAGYTDDDDREIPRVLTLMCWDESSSR